LNELIYLLTWNARVTTNARQMQREQTGRQVLWIDVQYPETRFLETKQAMMLAMYNSVWTV